MNEGQNSAAQAQANDQLSMAAVGRQFTDLAVKNEQLRSDLQKVVAIANEKMAEINELTDKLAELEGEAAELRKPLIPEAEEV